MTSTQTGRISGVNSSAAIKVPCRVATIANITLSGLQTIDGIAVIVGDRVLVKDQAVGARNGIYIASESAWTRADDFDGTRDIVRGTQVYVYDGSTQTAGTYRLDTINPIIGTSSLSFLKSAEDGGNSIGDITGLQAALDAKASTASVALKADVAGETFTGTIDFSGTTHPGIRLNTLTTTQRNALTPAAGMIIYNSTTGKIEGYDNSAAWVDLGAQAGAGTGDMVKATYDAANISQQLVGLTATQTLTNKTLTSPTVSGGTIDNCIIGGTTKAAGSFTQLTVNGSAISLTSSGTATLTTTGNTTFTSGGRLYLSSSHATEDVSLGHAGGGDVVIYTDAGDIAVTATDELRLTAGNSSQMVLRVDTSTITLDAAAISMFAAGGEIDCGSSKLLNLVDPASAQDAATKAYVDSVAAVTAINKPAVRVATTAALAANTYNNGASGVGATLTANANGAIAAVDGVTLVLNDRLIVKNEATGANNGVYYVSQVGTAGTPYILTRATDTDTAAEITYASALVTSGSTNGGTTWNCPTTSITVGTTAISWVQTSISSSVGAFYQLSEVTVTTETRSTDTNVRQMKFALGVSDMLRFTQASTVAHAYSNTMFVERYADYSGGTAGWVNSAGRFYTEASNGTTSYEWALLGVIDNYGQGENVGLYGQGNRRSSAATSTWGATVEARDHTETNTGSLVGLEVDCFANGSDTNRNRVGIDVISGKGVSGGAASQSHAGIRVESVNLSTDGSYINGIMVGDSHYRSPGAGLTCTTGINLYTNGTTGVWDQGTKTVGFYASGTYSGSAFRMKSGAYFAYDDSDLVKTRYDGVYIEHNTAMQIAATGAAGRAVIEASGSTGFQYGIDFGASNNFASGFVLRSGRINLQNDGVIDLAAQSLQGSAGSLAGYAAIKVAGSSYKMPIYNL